MARSVSLLSLASLVAAVSVHVVEAKSPPQASGDAKAVKVRDGLYTIADRSIACRVRGDHFACSNRFETVVCRGVVCEVVDESNYPPDIVVDAKDARRPDAHVLKAGAVFEFPSAGCWPRRSYIECVVDTPQGGFQMSGLFSRVLTWDSTPSWTWPWDGKRYSLKDLPCTKPSCADAPRRGKKSRH